MSKIAFIGTGVMGAAMAGHLMDAGHDLIVYNRTKSKTDGLVARGAAYAENPQKAAAQADFVITIDPCLRQTGRPGRRKSPGLWER